MEKFAKIWMKIWTVTLGTIVVLGGTLLVATLTFLGRIVHWGFLVPVVILLVISAIAFLCSNYLEGLRIQRLQESNRMSQAKHLTHLLNQLGKRLDEDES